MKRYFYNIIAVAAALFSLSACTEAIEEIFTPTSEDAATVKFQLGVDAVNGVQFGSRAIYDYESEVNDVTVFLIDVNTKKVTQLQWEAGEIATETVSNHIVLDLAAKDEDVNGNEVKAGTYDVYALANFNSSLGTVFLDDIDTEAKVKSLLAMNLERSIECKGSDRLPMAAMSDPSKPFKVKSDSQLGQGEYNILDAHLKRLNAHIEFNFSSGTGVTFTPQYYRIYNLPKQAKPFAAEADRTPDETFDYPENISLIKSSFEFWVLENSQASNSAVTAYTERDRWNGYISNTQKKNFTNAPEKSTYVVVTGNYEDANYTGTVSYTIHLGNMMNNQWGNFSALRNEYHTYNVKVNGVNSILVECKVTGNTGTENQPGVDGNIISKTNVANTYIIDAHYETLMAEIAATTVTATPLTMTVRMASPKTGFGVGEAAVYTIDNNGTITDTKTNQTVTLDQTDLKWFQFVKPTATESSAPYATGCATCSGSGKIYTTTYVVCTACSGTGIIKANSTTHPAFPTFPGYDSSNLGYITDFVKNPSNYCMQHTDGKYYTAIFVDEYYYNGMDFNKWVNCDNRYVLLSASSAKHESADKASSVVTQADVYISQRSIKSSYIFSSDTPNPFGIETWDETGHTKFGTGNPQTTDYPSITQDKLEGWKNTAAMAAKSNSYRTRVNVGYGNSVQDGERASHVYSQTVSNPMQAMCARNRDFNHNGVIDDDEIRWYIPAIDQFGIFFMGDGALTDDSKLYDKADLIKKPQSWGAFCAQTRKPLYTSTSGKWICLADAGFTDDPGNYNSGVFNNGYWLRCCRNLGQEKINTSAANYTPISSPVTHKVTDATANTTIQIYSKKGIINTGKVRSQRSINRTTPYTVHDILSDQNLLPHAFEYVFPTATDLGLSSNKWTITKKSGTNRTETANYDAAAAVENAYNTKQQETGWRVPNQRELMAMYIAGIFDKVYSDANRFGCKTLWLDDSHNGDVLANDLFFQVHGVTITGGKFCLDSSFPTCNFNTVLVRDVDVAKPSQTSGYTINDWGAFTSGK